MNAQAFRHFFDYHFAENRKIWDRHISALSDEQFTRPAGYSRGSVRDQLLHMIDADDVWFSELANEPPAEPFPAGENDRRRIRAYWDGVEAKMRRYLAGLADAMLFEHPIQEPEEDRGLITWQVLLHVANHATDHRAQLLRHLNDLGQPTEYQDYIFYVYEHPPGE